MDADAWQQRFGRCLASLALSVFARKYSDEAIQYLSYIIMDCFTLFAKTMQKNVVSPALADFAKLLRAVSIEARTKQTATPHPSFSL